MILTKENKEHKKVTNINIHLFVLFGLFDILTGLQKAI